LIICLLLDDFLARVRILNMAAQSYDYGASLPVSPYATGGKVSPYDYQEVSVEEELDRLNKAQAEDLRIKKRLRRLRAVQRTSNLLISIVVLGIMLNTYLTFSFHRTDSSSGTTLAIYPTQPILWPTYMMLSTSAVSMVFNCSILVAYCCGVAASNKVSSYSSYWGYFVHVLNFAVWIATSTTFKMMEGGASDVPPPRDLWGWTCSDAASALVQKTVNFDLQCTTQQVSFAVGLVNAGLEIFSIVITIIAVRRLLHKKKVARLASERASM